MQRSDPSRHRRSPFRRASRVAVTTVGALALIAVGATGAFAQSAGGGGGGGFGRFGGLGGSGKLTSRSGSTLELQGFTGNTSKVIVTTSTKYRQTEATDASAIIKGACIRVNGTGDTSTGITASNVSVLDGTQACTARRITGRRNFPGRNGSGGNGETPSGGSLPNGGSLPSGGSFPRGGAGRGGNVSGTVKSVSGDNIVVTAQVPKTTGTSNSNSSAPLKFVKKNVKVTLDTSTKVEHTVPATDTVLVVGTCLATQGSSDSVGTVTAKTVTASQPDSNGDCTAGFGNFGGFNGTPPTTSGSI